MHNLKVKDLLKFSTTQPTLIPAHTPLRDVARQLVLDPLTREVYVTDEQNRFIGVITLRRLARSVFAGHAERLASPVSLLELVSAQTADQLALKKPAFVLEEDTLARLLDVMFRYDVNEIPVVNRQKTVVGNLNMLEILQAWLDGKLQPPLS